MKLPQQRLKQILSTTFPRLGLIKSVNILQGGMSSNYCFAVETKGSMYVVILYDKLRRTKEQIEFWHEISSYLHKKGFKVRHPIEKVLKSVSFQNAEYWVSLYNFIEGETIPWNSFNSGELIKVGQLMADLHFALKDFDNKVSDDLLWHTRVLSELEQDLNYFRRVEKYITQKLNFRINWNRYAEVVKKVLSFLEEKDVKSQTILHYDLQRSNILFKVGNISGIIDFEQCCVGPEIADIAKSLTFFLIDREFHSHKYVRHYFLEGYEEGKNKLPDLEYLYPLIKYHYMHELKHLLFYNPFEALGVNSYFRKVIEYLIRKKYLSEI